MYRDGNMDNLVRSQMKKFQLEKMKETPEEIRRGRANPRSANRVNKIVSPVSWRWDSSLPVGRHSIMLFSWINPFVMGPSRSFSMHLDVSTLHQLWLRSSSSRKMELDLHRELFSFHPDQQHWILASLLGNRHGVSRAYAQGLVEEKLSTRRKAQLWIGSGAEV